MAKKISRVTKAAASAAPTSTGTFGSLMNLPTFVSTFRDNLENEHDTRYCFVLGSGASISSGIRSGASLVNDWLRWLHQQCCPEEPEAKLQAWTEKEFKKWTGFTWERRFEFYGRIYSERFQDNANGQEWLRRTMAAASPSFGYIVLSQVLATTKHNVVITTNFDNLVQEALNLIGQPRSFIAHSPAEAAFIGQNASKPRILKIHGDIDRETYNRENLIEALEPAWHDALRQVFDLYTPIFIGYGGCDPGLMQFLNEHYRLNDNRRRPLWTYRVDSKSLKAPLSPSLCPPGHPDTAFVQTFFDKHKAFWVPTPGFDELMLLLSPALKDKHDAAAVRAAAETTAQALEKSRTDACRTARSHDGAHWCPQLDVLTKAAEKHHLGEVQRWSRGEWREYVTAGIGPAEQLARCEEAVSKLPDSPWVHSMNAAYISKANPQDPRIDAHLAQAANLLKSGVYGDNSDEAMAVLSHRGLIELARGHAKEAEAIYKDVVKRRVDNLGAEHPETLGSRNDLAISLQAQGKNAEAEQVLRDVLAICQRSQGVEHRATLASRNNLANVLQAQGKNAEAEQEHRAVLAVRQRVKGAEHPDTLSSRNNLASTLHAQGKNDEAEREHREVLALRLQVLGAEHPDTLASRNNLAASLQHQGKHHEAERELREVLAILQRVQGIEHPATLKCWSNLAATLQAQGKHEEAELENREVVALRLHVLGEDHSDTLASRNNLATSLQGQDKNAEAELEHRAVLSVQQRLQSAEHPDVFTSCYNLALCLRKQGKLIEALQFMQRAQTGWLNVLGEGHLHSRRAKADLVSIQQELRDQQK